MAHNGDQPAVSQTDENGKPIHHTGAMGEHGTTGAGTALDGQQHHGGILHHSGSSGPISVTETTNAQGQTERRVDTVDYRTSAGQPEEQKPVQVVHQLDSSTSGGILSGAAAAVATTLEAAKEAISGDHHSTNSKNR
uniref:Uncharacterized protein n=1 Tax=Davidia involucrata TaxID=16924 RepID=A0A5B6YYJ9_DAVIN